MYRHIEILSLTIDDASQTVMAATNAHDFKAKAFKNCDHLFTVQPTQSGHNFRAVP
jgi:hypothetical protein